MKVELIKPYGLCQGAQKAVDLVLKVRKENKDGRIFLFGPIVHNEIINKELEKNRINILDLPYEEYFDVIDTLRIGDIVILPAHGHDNSLENKLISKGVLYVDATCPIVKRIHKLILENSKNNEVIYIGKKNHIEAITSVMLSDNVYLYDLNDGFINGKPKSLNPSIIVQSTLTIYDVEEALNSIKTDYKDAKLIPSLCNACLTRQNKLKAKINEKTYLLVVGSPTSSNTNSLLKMYYKSTKTANFALISSFEDIKKIKFSEEFDYLIVSGTSTPKKLVDDIYNYIKSL